MRRIITVLIPLFIFVSGAAAQYGAPSAGTPKVFVKYFYVNTVTGEKSGEMLAVAKFEATEAIDPSKSGNETKYLFSSWSDGVTERERSRGRHRLCYPHRHHLPNLGRPYRQSSPRSLRAANRL